MTDKKVQEEKEITEEKEVKEKKVKEKVIKIIKQNYKSLENVMWNELDLASNHGGLCGHSRETMWMEFFRKIIPQKFAMEQGVIIMDSEGNVSKEVDIVVFDNQYTPYLFQYGTLKFIPIEAVAIVIECKSSGWVADSLKKWSESIEKLKTSFTGIARIVQGYSMACTATSQTSTRPIRILASIRENLKEETVDEIKDFFDIIMFENKETGEKEKSLQVEIPNEGKSLGWWGSQLNKREEIKQEIIIKAIDSKDNQKEKRPDKDFADKLKKDHDYLEFCENGYLTNTLEDFIIDGNPLLSLNFQLNQLLMLINNPMLFPHLAYVNLFKKGIKTDEK